MTSTIPSIAWLNEPRQPVSREFLADTPLRHGEHAGQPGYFVCVRLTSYRSLPLSCIESIQLSVSERTIDPSSLILILGGTAFRASDLAHLGNHWWFILDYADLFFPAAFKLGAGLHIVEGTLVTVEPYMTAGRFSFTHTSRRTLSVAGTDS